METELIRSFLAITRCETISKAADEMYITQSTMTHRMQLLEKSLGVQLFHHKKGFKKIELTEPGKRLVPIAERWLNIEQEMTEINADNSLGTIHVGAMDSINQFLLPKIISCLPSKIPNLQMVFLSYHSEHIYQMLSSRQLDIGFAFNPAHYNLEAVPVFYEPLYMICCADSIYPDGPIHPKQLNKRNEIMPCWDSESVKWNNEWWDPSIPPKLTVDSSGLMSAFLNEPENWSICPASVAFSLLETRNLEIHEFTTDPPHRTCFMLYRKYKGSVLPEGIKLFIESFQKELATHPWQYVE